MTKESTQAGRIARIVESGFDLVRDGRWLRIAWGSKGQDARLRPGDLVTVPLGADGETVDGEVTRVRPWIGDEPFPPPGSDWLRLHAKEKGVLRSLADRASLLQAVRTYFDEEGFIEVETPAVAASPAMEPHLEAVQVQLRESPGGALTERWLVTSPEYHMKRLLSAGAMQIYQIARAFRSGESGSHHNPEFTILEWYRGFATVADGIADTVGVICAATQALRGSLRIPWRGGTLDLTPPWPTRTVREAIQEWAGFDPLPTEPVEDLRRRAITAGLPLDSQDTTAADILIRALVTSVEPSLPRDRPIILTDYPRCMASLAQCRADDPSVAERFEIHAGGLELANGFGELIDPDEQRRRFEEEGRERKRRNRTEHPVDARFLRALQVGCPPATGVALGVDRLLMLTTDRRDIAEVLPFPHDQT